MTLSPTSSRSGTGGSSSAVATVSVSSAQLLALGGSALQLVAAAGAGKILIPTYAAFVYTPGNTAYTGTLDLEIGQGNGGGSPFVDAVMYENADAGGLGTDPLFESFYLLGSSGTPRELNPLLMRNVGLFMDNSGNALTLGNGTLKVIIDYITVTA